MAAKSLHQRLVEKVHFHPWGGCWEWTGGADIHGYGRIWSGGKTHLTHRVAFYLQHGYLPEVVAHACDNPKCVNPAHLWGGSQADNLRDMFAKGRDRNGLEDRTHCAQGHPYEGGNLRITAQGHRECRVCRRGWQAKYKAKIRARK